MPDFEPDLEELFAPLRPAQAGDVVLSEARDVLAQVRVPVDAELWGSDMLGALPAGHARSGSADAGDLGEGTAGASLVSAAEREPSPAGLALLRVLGAVAAPAVAAAATEAAGRVAARGVPEPGWAAVIGTPEVGACWHYGDTMGQQESVTLTFGYGSASHALCVLIDHLSGGKVKDAWVDDATGLLDKTWLAAAGDPQVVFETIEPRDAAQRLARALAAGECPAKPDEAADLAAHRALLHARVRYLTAP